MTADGTPLRRRVRHLRGPRQQPRQELSLFHIKSSGQRCPVSAGVWRGSPLPSSPVMVRPLPLRSSLTVSPGPFPLPAAPPPENQRCDLGFCLGTALFSLTAFCSGRVTTSERSGLKPMGCPLAYGRVGQESERFGWVGLCFHVSFFPHAPWDLALLGASLSLPPPPASHSPEPLRVVASGQ